MKDRAIETYQCKISKYVSVFFPEGHGHFDDEASNPFEQDHNDRNLCEDRSMFEPPNLGLGKDTEIILGSGVVSLRGGAKRLKLSIPVGTSDDLPDTSRKLPNGHMLGETMIVHSVREVFCIRTDYRTPKLAKDPLEY